MTDVNGARSDQASPLLRALCASSIEHGDSETVFNVKDLAFLGSRLGIEHSDMTSALLDLSDEGSLRIGMDAAEEVTWVIVTDEGLDLHVRDVFPRYEIARKEIAQMLRSRRSLEDGDYSSRLGSWRKRPAIVVNHILRDFEKRGLLKLSDPSGFGHFDIHDISPGIASFDEA